MGSIFRRLAAFLAMAALCIGAGAQTYPSKPITLIVPFPPGGVTDLVGRAVAARLSTELGQNVIVENKAGASGALGTAFAAKAAPDGYTLLLGNISTLGTNVATFAKLPYDPLTSFTPVSMLAVQPLVIAVNSSVPAQSLADLIKLAKEKPGSLSFGTAGSSIQLAVELFDSMAGMKMLHVPYKGSAPAISDLIGGQINVLFDPISTLYPQVKAGKVRGLGVTTGARSSAAPDLPTVIESGLPGYDVSSWQALVVPAGTPQPVIDRLHEALAKVLSMPDTKELFERQGAQPALSSPADAEQFIRTEIARWKKVAQEAGVKPQ